MDSSIIIIIIVIIIIIIIIITSGSFKHRDRLQIAPQPRRRRPRPRPPVPRQIGADSRGKTPFVSGLPPPYRSVGLNLPPSSLWFSRQIFDTRYPFYCLVNTVAATTHHASHPHAQSASLSFLGKKSLERYWKPKEDKACISAFFFSLSMMFNSSTHSLRRFT